MREQSSKLITGILIGYAVTFFVINFADSLTMIVDGMVISRGLGAKALAATGLADPSYKFVSLFSGMLSAGLGALCASAMCTGDREKVNRLFSAGITATAVLSALLSILGFVFTGALCSLFGAGDDLEVREHLFGYLRGWFVGIPGYLFFFVLSPLVTLDGNKKNVTVATFVQSIVNIVGDILAVFVLDAGAWGVGLATGLAFDLSALVLAQNFLRKHSVFKPFSAPPDFKALPGAVATGLPRITEQVCRILGPLFINRTILAVGGSLAMSASSVKTSIFGFCVIIGKGVSESVGLLTQILYGEKDAPALRNTVKTALRLLLVLDSAFSAVLFVLSGTVAGLYFPSGTEEWTAAVMAVRFLALSLLLNGCNLIIIQYLQSAGKMVPTHLMTAFHRILALAVLTYLLGSWFGTVGLFAAIPVSEAVVLAGYLVAALIGGHGRGFWDSVLMIPNGFGYNSSNSCSFCITTVEEAVSVSEQVESFCYAHGVDERTSFFSGRCMEEVTANVIEHGFTQDEKKHYCDVMVKLDPGQVVLRIRDNCPYFNIRERYDSLSDDDYESSLGIRLVYANAKDVSYINIFNTNTLIITM